MRRFLVLMLVAGATVTVTERDALACSCLRQDVKKTLSETDGAFVGVAVDVPDQSIRAGLARRDALWHFRVNGVYKGVIPAEVTIEAPVHGASCGLELEEGDRVGLFVDREGRRLRSNLCWKVGAADMQLTGVRPSAPIPIAAAAAPAEGANAFPVEALWALASAMLLLTVALMMARQRAES